MKAENMTKKQLIAEVERLRGVNADLKNEAKEAMARSEAQLRDILDNLTDVVVELDENGNFTYISPQIKEGFGFEQKDIVGKSAFDFVHPDDLERATEVYQEVIDGKRSFTIEYRTLHKDGHYIEVSSRTRVITDPDGGLKFIGLIMDITERKRAEEELRLLSLAVEQSREGLAVANMDGNLLFLNKAFANMHGYSPKEIIGKNLSIFHTPDQMPEVEAANRQIKKTGEFSGEIWHLRQDGTVFPTLMNNSLLRNESGNPIGLIGTIRDITERKLSEEALRESEEKFRMLFENAGEGILYINDNGIIDDINPKALEIAGRKNSEIQGKNVMDLFTIFNLDPEVMGPAFNGFLTGNPPPENEWEITNPKGQKRTLLAHPSVMKKNGDVIGLSVIIEDITERKEAEGALRESEQKYSALVEKTTDVIAIVQDGVIKFVNSAAEKLVGYKRRTIMEKDFLSFVAPEHRKVVIQRYKKRMAGKSVPAIYEITVMGKRKKRIPVELNASLIEFEGKLTDLVIIRDITERKKMEEELKRHRDHLEELVKERTKELTTANKKLQKQIAQREKAEEALRENEERLRAILSSLHDTIVVVVDKESKHIFVSGTPEMAKRYGIDSKEFMGNTFRDIFNSEEAELRIQGLQAIFDSGMSVRDELIFDTPTGQYWHDMSFAPLYDKDGNVTAVVGVSRDITDRKKVEKEIKRSEEKYRNLFENSLVGMFRLSMKDGALIEANNTFKEMLGLKTLNDVMVWDIFAIMEDKGVIHQHIREGGGLMNFETQFKRTDGSLFWASVNAKQFPKDGFIEGVIIDITEKKKLEEEIQKMNKLESLGILAGGIAHDFNNVLTTIMGNISLAKSYSVSDEKVFKKLDEAERASLQARELSQKLITFSKGGKPIKKTGSVKDLILESVDLVISGMDVVADIAIPNDLWPVEIDQGQMSQVLNNLLINAQQAMPKGGNIDISAQNTKIRKKDALPLESGDYIMVTISDTGKGIPKPDLPNIFDPFYSTKPDGSGLGLTTCYSIVKAHGGHITVESLVGKGSTFHIYLPVTKAVKKARKRKTQHRILIMDDERTIRDVLAEMLTDHGYYVETAVSGEEAIELYRSAKKKRRPFHLVIMDLMIANGMGGKETITELKEFDPKIKAVVSSGYSEDSLMADYKGHGFLAVLSKPYKIADLLRIIEDVIKKK